MNQEPRPDPPRPRPLRRALHLALLGALPLAFASCGGGSDSNDAGPPAQTGDAVWDAFDWDGANWS